MKRIKYIDENYSKMFKMVGKNAINARILSKL